VGDFLDGKASTGAGSVEPTYRPGVTWCDLHEVLPEKITASIAEALPKVDEKLKGFAANEAILTGVETRTSSPIRIPRNDDYLAFDFTNLYPCGEGAGYAGGITSAAVDGIKCALAIMKKYRPD
jgi:uncharacterized FAD-dependent dehydrogenase